MKTCCFIGHRKIEITNELVLSLKRVIQTLIIDENVQTFAFGSKSEFNDLCHLLVTELQKKFKGIERVCLTCRNECCSLKVKEKNGRKFTVTFWSEKYIYRVTNGKLNTKRNTSQEKPHILNEIKHLLIWVIFVFFTSMKNTCRQRKYLLGITFPLINLKA